jgi:hypothetical protein
VFKRGEKRGAVTNPAGHVITTRYQFDTPNLQPGQRPLPLLTTPVVFVAIDFSTANDDEQFIDPTKVVSYNFFTTIPKGTHLVEGAGRRRQRDRSYQSSDGDPSRGHAGIPLMVQQ